MNPIVVAAVAAGALILLGNLAGGPKKAKGPVLVQEGVGTYFDPKLGAYNIHWKIIRESNGRFTWHFSFLDSSRAGYSSGNDFGTAKLAKDAMLATHPGLEIPAGSTD